MAQAAVASDIHQALDVQAMLQDGFEAAVRERIDVDGPFARRLQTGVAVILGETQNAQATAVALLGMAALMQTCSTTAFLWLPIRLSVTGAMEPTAMKK